VHPYHARCFVKRLLDVQREGLAANNNDDTHDSRSKGNITSLCRSSS
jgi:prolyl oligopeptidase PreP (S9A serine peptidase family)